MPSVVTGEDRASAPRLPGQDARDSMAEPDAHWIEKLRTQSASPRIDADRHHQRLRPPAAGLDGKGVLVRHDLGIVVVFPDEQGNCGMFDDSCSGSRHRAACPPAFSSTRADHQASCRCRTASTLDPGGLEAGHWRLRPLAGLMKDAEVRVEQLVAYLKR